MTSHAYHLPISIIVAMMKEGTEHLALRALLPAVPAIAPGMCVADIVVGEQGLQACAIIEQRSGQVLRQNGEAFSILQQCGSLPWTLLPQEPSARQERPLLTHVVPSSEEAGKIPRRTAICTPAQMQAWPHTETGLSAGQWEQHR